MKTNPALILAAAATFLTLTGCDKKPAGGAADPQAAPAVIDEKTAIANFKTEVEAVGKWIDEKQKTAPTDPVAGMAMMGEVIGKIKAVKTDGLPADLKGAWGEMGGVLTEMGDIFKNMPPKTPEKPEDAMKAMGEIMPKMMAIQAKMGPIS
ncbi:MAG: hypothetical protein ABMA01_21560, partial [Chthoniobacteraceae bacterium]